MNTSTPHRCPVCNGHKTVSRPPHIAGDVPTWSACSIETYPCPACDATGIVWSHEIVEYRGEPHAVTLLSERHNTPENP